MHRKGILKENKEKRKRNRKKRIANDNGQKRPELSLKFAAHIQAKKDALLKAKKKKQKMKLKVIEKWKCKMC